MDRLLRTVIVLAGVLSVVGGAAAGTEGDDQTLRAWCVQRTANQDNAAWQAANNPERYFHFQHFCFAMPWENKLVTAANQQDRVTAANTIINETSYVIRHVPRTHFLIPEVHVLRGRAYYASKRYVEAEVDLLAALQLDPRHARAAVQLATLYRNTDRPAKAVGVVQGALSGSPGDFRLRKLGKELGVALPPVPERAQAPDRPAAPEQPVATSVPEAATDARSAAAAAAATDEGSAAEAAEAVDGATSACRFCPPEEIQQRWRDYFDEAQKP